VARGRRYGAAGLAKEALDDAVLEAVKAHDRQPAAAAEQGFGGKKPLLELIELGIDVDPDRLKAARGRVLRCARPIAQGLPHDLGQLAGGRQGPCRDDGPRDAP
jgi:hypothetical protein